MCLCRTDGEVGFIIDSSSACGGLDVCLCGLCECSFSRVARSVRRTLALSISSGESVVRRSNRCVRVFVDVKVAQFSCLIVASYFTELS